MDKKFSSDSTALVENQSFRIADAKLGKAPPARENRNCYGCGSIGELIHDCPHKSLNASQRDKVPFYFSNHAAMLIETSHRSIYKFLLDPLAYGHTVKYYCMLHGIRRIQPWEDIFGNESERTDTLNTWRSNEIL